MRYVEVRPGPSLLPLVECLWWAEGPLRHSPREPQRILPDGCPELIVHLGDRFSRLRAGRWIVQPRAFLAGALTRPWLVRGGRRVRTLGVRFRPACAPRVLPIHMQAATDRETVLARVVGSGRSARLLARVGAATTTKSRLAATEAWLLEGLAPASRRGPGPRRRDRGAGALGARPPESLGRRAVGTVLEARGQVRITEVAERCGATVRQLERAFAREVGLRPKLFARIVRLNAFLERLEEGRRERMVDLALEAGFFDQAHLLRDFRFLAGRSPTRGRVEDGDLARHFTLPSRLRALFAFD